MTTPRTLLSVFMTICLLGIGVQFVHAATFTDFTQGLGQAGTVATENNLPQDQDAQVLLRRIIRYILSFVGLIGLLFLIFAGIMYMTSLGDEKKAAQAKKLILYVIVGLILVGLSALIVNAIIAFLR